MVVKSRYYNSVNYINALFVSNFFLFYKCECLVDFLGNDFVGRCVVFVGSKVAS